MLMLNIIAKQLKPEVTTISGWIVYVMNENDRPIEAKVCNLVDLGCIIDDFKTKYKI